MSEEPKPRWWLAAFTMAVLIGGFVFLFVPSLRVAGAAILGGYFILVELALNKSIYEDHFARQDRRSSARHPDHRP